MARRAPRRRRRRAAPITNAVTLSGGIDAHRLGGDLVLAHRQEGAGRAARTSRFATSAHDHQDGRREDDTRSCARRRDAEEARRTPPRNPLRGADPVRRSSRMHADDLAEPEGDDRQVVAAEPQARQPDELAEERRGQAAAEHRRRGAAPMGEERSRRSTLVTAATGGAFDAASW